MEARLQDLEKKMGSLLKEMTKAQGEYSRESLRGALADEKKLELIGGRIEILCREIEKTRARIDMEENPAGARRVWRLA